MTLQLTPPPAIDFTRQYSLEEFLELPFDDDYEYELVGGYILAKTQDPGPSAPHAEAAGNIYHTIKNFIGPNKATLGQVWIEASCRLEKVELYVKPDVTYLPASEIPAQGFSGPITGLPALVVEVNSLSDTVETIDSKIANYFRAGVELVWSVYPTRKTVEVLQPNQEKGITFGLSDELDASMVLPGFKLAVRTIFQ